jgi:hypothetical protein
MAVFMQGPDQEFLASAGLTGYKDGAVGRSHLGQDLKYLVRRAFADNALGFYAHKPLLKDCLYIQEIAVKIMTACQ